MIRIRYILLVLVAVLSVPLQAQVWTTDFEDEAERAQWVLNPLNPLAVANGWSLDDLSNFWCFGKAGNHTKDGEWGLFVSNNGVDATYSSEFEGVVAYRELALPAGIYNVYFDWRAQGKTLGEGFIVSWIPEDETVYSLPAAFPLEMRDYVIHTDTFAHSASWRRGEGKITINSTGEKYKLAFYWVTSGGGNPVPPSVCIDNIEIYAGGCEMPTGLNTRVTGSGVELTWLGASDYYDVLAYDVPTDTWQEFLLQPHNPKQNKLIISNLSEGLNTLYVRGVCEPSEGEYIRSNYSTIDVFVFHAGSRCIDYMDLYNTSFVRCIAGTATGADLVGGRAITPINFGYASIDSRHTLHYVPTEYDPRTEGGLKTVPEGYIASVRLGNWNTGSQAERITYRYHVSDSEKAILQLKYALVLEDPGHAEHEQPRFTLRVRANNQSIECAEADFKSGINTNNDATWHTCQGESGPLHWKDWTDVSVNLRDYVGQELTIELTTYDCTQSGHYGYAYFVLDCDDGGLSGLNCGEDNPTTTFTAPDGFDYYWYYIDAETGAEIEKSREQTLTIDPMDTITYHVDVISKVNAACYYTLDACGIPRFPVADGTAVPTVIDCKNVVEFTNLSEVWYKNQVSDSTFTRDEEVDDIFWDFGDGTTSDEDAKTIMHTYPVEGGHFTAKLVASISNGACEVVKEFAIDLPSLDSTRVEHISVGGTCTVGENTYTYYNAGQFAEYYEIENGCTVEVEVNVYEKEFSVQDSICEGGVYVFAGDTLVETGTYVAYLKKTVLGAEHLDSIVTLNLHVEPMLQVAVSDTIVVCADEQMLYIPYEILQGKMQEMALLFADTAVALGFDSVYTFAPNEAIVVPLPADVIPDRYWATLQLGTEQCPVPDVQLCVQVNYPSSIVAQKDGVVALLNENYNGGYTFLNYQWYRNGEPIEGAVDSYVPVTTEDAGAEYTVVVTREGDGTVLPTCPIVYNMPVGVDDVWADCTVYPTVVSSGGELRIMGGDNYEIYNLLGGFVQRGLTGTIVAPSVAGVYFVKVNNKSHAQIVKILVR